MLTYDDFKAALPDAHEYQNYLLARCVFHDDKEPSMLVFRDGWWRCLGCNRWGGWITLWNKLKGQPIIIRPEHRTGWRGPNISSYENLEVLCYQAHEDLLQFSNSYKWYLEQRGLEGRIEANEIGYHEGWYTVPVKDREGTFITAVFRSAPHVQSVTGERYWVHHANIPFVPDWHLFESAKTVFVVYGIFDALTLAELRLPVMTSIAGQNFDPGWLADYRKPILIIPDEGEEESAIELQKNLGWRGKAIHLDYPHGKKDPNGFFEVGRKDDLYKQLLQYT